MPEAAPSMTVSCTTEQTGRVTSEEQTRELSSDPDSIHTTAALDFGAVVKKKA